MKFQEQRNKLFKMFIFLGIGFFFLINFAHWLNYRPIKSRIDRFVEQAYDKQPVAFLSYTEHNARLKEILMLKLDGVEEAVPMIFENPGELEKVIDAVDQKICFVHKEADSFVFSFQCDKKITTQLKDLRKTAWLGGINYAVIGAILIFIIGFITSRKMSDEKFADNFV